MIANPEGSQSGGLLFSPIRMGPIFTNLAGSQSGGVLVFANPEGSPSGGFLFLPSEGSLNANLEESNVFNERKLRDPNSYVDERKSFSG